ncbi:DNA alkylation repair protein [Paenibacillus yanchengensis]|uniref:DNA alkylation repair protein n=1 Tax=Paenibacillus yanchengensis TaxID=2035833 RepID=A0ABW4YIK3_9BACL
MLTFEEVMQQLEQLSKERMKKIYMSNGAQEPLFGVTTGEMKPMRRQIKINQPLAEQLYATGNYDAMYFAGVIADPNAMTKDDYERWIDAAYFYMISDFVVAVTLSESDIAQEVADGWIASGDELKMSAGWSCYCWLLGNRADDQFKTEKLARMLQVVEREIATAPERTKYSMSNFVFTTAVSYVPLHEEATNTAVKISPLEIPQPKGKSKFLNAKENIDKALARGQIGFKRKHVRC